MNTHEVEQARWLDRMLGRTAVDGQHTDEPLPAGRQDNLWRPVPGDHGAHGRFDATASSTSAQYWLTTHRGVMGLAALCLVLLLNGGSRTPGSSR